MRLQDQAVLGQLLFIERKQRLIEGIGIIDALLPAATRGAYRLDPHRPFVQKAPPGVTRILDAEGAVAGQHAALDLGTEVPRPADRRHGVRTHQRMSDRFGFDKGLRHDTTKQVTLLVQPQLLGFAEADDGARRYQVGMGVIATRWIVLTAVTRPQQGRQAFGQGRVDDLLVLRLAWSVGIGQHDPA
jgi:hypothetical protein